MPVFIPQTVLDEMQEHAHTAGAKETGGIFIGSLSRDAASNDILAEVSAEIPARHALSELHSLTFTAEVWTEVRAALALRRKRNELMLGWWHSHSYLKEVCKDCRRRKEKTCNTSAVFMSEKDRLVHRTVFNRAFNIAMVIGESPCHGMEYGLFGWRNGTVQKRAFYIT